MLNKAFMLSIIIILACPFNTFALDGDEIQDVLQSVVVIRTQNSIGSGFAVDPQLVITNAHVVSGSSKVSIETYSGSNIEGKIIKIDDNVDLALVQVEGIEFVPLILGETEASAGDDVYAIGAPSNIPFTLTKGIVSAGTRWIDNYDYVQIDASINTGNSGGPLLNETGEVIGINTLKLSHAEGIGFALKTSYIVEFMQKGITEQESNTSLEPSYSAEGSEYDENSKYKLLLLRNARLIKIIIVESAILFLLLIYTVKKKYIASLNQKNIDFVIEIDEEYNTQEKG